MMYADSILAAYDEYLASEAQAAAVQAENENVLLADDEYEGDEMQHLPIAPPRRHDSTASDASTIDTPVSDSYVP